MEKEGVHRIIDPGELEALSVESPGGDVGPFPIGLERSVSHAAGDSPAGEALVELFEIDRYQIPGPAVEGYLACGSDQPATGHGGFVVAGEQADLLGIIEDLNRNEVRFELLAQAFVVGGLEQCATWNQPDALMSDQPFTT